MRKKQVRLKYDLMPDKTDPSLRLEKDSVFTVEDVVESWVILRRENGTSCMVDIPDFERGFEALGECPGE